MALRLRRETLRSNGPNGLVLRSRGVASGSFGHVRNNQHGRLVALVVAPSNDAQRSPAAETDQRAVGPIGYGCAERRRISGCAVRGLEPEHEAGHPVPPLRIGWGRTVKRP